MKIDVKDLAKLNAETLLVTARASDEKIRVAGERAIKRIVAQQASLMYLELESPDVIREFVRRSGFTEEWELIGVMNAAIALAYPEKEAG